jgi:hypothetical protein
MKPFLGTYETAVKHIRLIISLTQRQPHSCNGGLLCEHVTPSLLCQLSSSGSA